MADRIADESEIRRGSSSRTSTLAAYLNADLEVPQQIRTALHNAAEIAYGNISEMRGPVVIGLVIPGTDLSIAGTLKTGKSRLSFVSFIAFAANDDTIAFDLPVRKRHREHFEL